MEMRKAARILLFASRLRFPNCPPYYFPFYMLVAYNQIRKSFKIRAAPLEFLKESVSKQQVFGDLSNCLLVDGATFVGNFAKIQGEQRYAHVIKINLDKNEVVLSEDLKFNLKNTEDQIKLYPVDIRSVKIATEIDLSLVNSQCEFNNCILDVLLKNYFASPKLVRKHDLIAVDFKRYAPDLFYVSRKLKAFEKVYFKCNRVLVDGSGEYCGFCVIGETAIKQSANIQSFIFPISNVSKLCPSGLDDHLEKLERCVRPFLRKNRLHRLKPAFLIQARKGSGKSEIVSSLARKLGIHFYETTSGDATNSIYAHNELKISNALFTAKLCAPCILTIKNFENFAKNNEGQHDERLMTFFINQLAELFANNNVFPIILICLSNSFDGVPAALCRNFLEIFDIPCPNERERLKMLEWILKSSHVDARMDEFARKTHGYLFEDLRALCFYARATSLRGGRSFPNDEDFEGALNIMQLRMNHSLGTPTVPKVRWEDVGGLTEAKREIVKTINIPLKLPGFLKSYGLKRSGILLYGPPGTGKTLIAKAVATECNLCFISVKGPELLNMYVGQSEKNIREVFERAREAAPCIIFFDELDSLAPNRGASGDSGGVMDRVVSQLLAEMDGLGQSATIFIIGATNRVDLIDGALLRPGRFDKLLYVGPCINAQSKLDVMKALTRKFKLENEDGSDLKDIIELCPESLTGADIYGLCSDAWFCAVRKLIEREGSKKDLRAGDVVVTMYDFISALDDLQPSVDENDLDYFEMLRREFSMIRD